MIEGAGVVTQHHRVWSLLLPNRFAAGTSGEFHLHHAVYHSVGVPRMIVELVPYCAKGRAAV